MHRGQSLVVWAIHEGEDLLPPGQYWYRMQLLQVPSSLAGWLLHPWINVLYADSISSGVMSIFFSCLFILIFFASRYRSQWSSSSTRIPFRLQRPSSLLIQVLHVFFIVFISLLLWCRECSIYSSPASWSCSKDSSLLTFQRAAPSTVTYYQEIFAMSGTGRVCAFASAKVQAFFTGAFFISVNLSFCQFWPTFFHGVSFCS